MFKNSERIGVQMNDRYEGKRDARAALENKTIAQGGVELEYNSVTLTFTDGSTAKFDLDSADDLRLTVERRDRVQIDLSAF